MSARLAGLIRAVSVGVASGMLGLGLRGWIFGAALIAAFLLTDWIAQKDVDDRFVDFGKRVAKVFRAGGVVR